MEKALILTTLGLFYRTRPLIVLAISGLHTVLHFFLRLFCAAT